MLLPVYFAISYVWGTDGDLDKTKGIILDGCPFPVTANVHAALQEFRSMFSWPFLVWIDSICIDQENKNEKLGQIPIMREIYHLSTIVLVSFGLRSAADAKLMRFIRDLNHDPIIVKTMDLFLNSYPIQESNGRDDKQESIAEWFRAMFIWESYAWICTTIAFPFIKFLMMTLDIWLNRCRDSQDPNCPAEPRSTNTAQVQKLKRWKPSRQSLRAVEKEDFEEMAQQLERTFFSRSRYFNRMWTLQEAVTGMAVMVQHCGIQIHLDAFTQTIFYLHNTTKGRLHNSLTETTASLWVVHHAWIRGKRLSLRELLFHCRNRDCGDGKDKIYALLGLINGRKDPRLQPDRFASIAQVYANATMYIIDSEQSLDVICVRGGQKGPDLEGIPSWTPNFRHFGVFDGAVCLVNSAGLVSLYNSSLEKRYLLSDVLETNSHETRLLHTTGLYLGTVHCTSETARPNENLEKVQKKWHTTFSLARHRNMTWKQHKMLSDISTLLTLYIELHDTAEVDKNRFWDDSKDKICPLVDRVCEATSKDLPTSYLLTLICGRLSLSTRCNADGIHSLLRRASSRGPEGQAALNSLYRALKLGMGGRRFVVLDEGLMGVVPAGTMVGDAVAVLIGCSVPVCLRRAAGSNEWILVGECYIHGYMDGEAIQQRDVGTLVARTYLLV
jgi:hypothetical protein